MTVITCDGRVRTREWPYCIMIKSSWSPGCLTVAVSTCCRELLRCVIGVGGLIIVICVTTNACVGWIYIVTLMAVITTNTCVSTHNRIKRVVERGRSPGRLTVAICAVHGELLCNVIGINRLVVVVRMTTSTGIRCIVVVTVVTGHTVV